MELHLPNLLVGHPEEDNGVQVGVEPLDDDDAVVFVVTVSLGSCE